MVVSSKQFVRFVVLFTTRSSVLKSIFFVWFSLFIPKVRGRISQSQYKLNKPAGTFQVMLFQVLALDEVFIDLHEFHILYS